MKEKTLEERVLALETNMELQQRYIEMIADAVNQLAPPEMKIRKPDEAKK